MVNRQIGATEIEIQGQQKAKQLIHNGLTGIEAQLDHCVEQIAVVDQTGQWHVSVVHLEWWVSHCIVGVDQVH